MNNTETKKRLANMTVIEKNLLADLCTKYQSVLENKRTDAVTVRVKEDTWKLLAEEFSAISTSGVQRQWNQLKHAYENMKSKAKKSLATDKVERLKTGGGSFIPQVDFIDEKMIALLGNRAQPMKNIYDSDAVYNKELGDDNLSQVESSFMGTSSVEILIPEENDGVISYMSTSDSLYNSMNTSQLTVMTIEQLVQNIQQQAASSSKENLAVECEQASTSGQHVAENSASGVPIAGAGKQWAQPNRRRRQQQLTRRCESSNETSVKIGRSAEMKTIYYEKKLELLLEKHAMAKAEHKERLELLKLKKKQIQQQMSSSSTLEE